MKVFSHRTAVNFISPYDDFETPSILARGHHSHITLHNILSMAHFITRSFLSSFFAGSQRNRCVYYQFVTIGFIILLLQFTTGSEHVLAPRLGEQSTAVRCVAIVALRFNGSFIIYNTGHHNQ